MDDNIPFLYLLSVHEIQEGNMIRSKSYISLFRFLVVYIVCICIIFSVLSVVIFVHLYFYSSILLKDGRLRTMKTMLNEGVDDN